MGTGYDDFAHQLKFSAKPPTGIFPQATKIIFLIQEDTPIVPQNTMNRKCLFYFNSDEKVICKESICDIL